MYVCMCVCVCMCMYVCVCVCVCDFAFMSLLTIFQSYNGFVLHKDTTGFRFHVLPTLDTHICSDSVFYSRMREKELDTEKYRIVKPYSSSIQFLCICTYLSTALIHGAAMLHPYMTDVARITCLA